MALPSGCCLRCPRVKRTAFTDVPATFNPRIPTQQPFLIADARRLHHAADHSSHPDYNKPEIDAAAFRLKVTGLAEKPAELSLADLKAMKPVDIVCGYECSGNSPRAMQGLSSNGRFTGVRLRDVLRRVDVDDRAREVVFFVADRGNEEVVFRRHVQDPAAVRAEHHAGKRDEAGADPGYSLNGQPLSRDHGSRCAW